MPFDLLMLPSHSPALSQIRAGQFRTPGPHKFQGLGPGFKNDVLDLELVDALVTVSNDEAIDFDRRLSREGGIACGAARFVACRVGARPEHAGKTIVVVLPDTGERYLSSTLFEDMPL